MGLLKYKNTHFRILKVEYVVVKICYQIFIQVAKRSLEVANLLHLISNNDLSPLQTCMVCSS